MLYVHLALHVSDLEIFLLIYKIMTKVIVPSSLIYLNKKKVLCTYIFTFVLKRLVGNECPQYIGRSFPALVEVFNAHAK